MKVAVIGSGYVGTVVAVSLARIGHEVIGVEIDAVKLEALSHGTVPFYEPGLETYLVEQLAAGSIRFTADMTEGVAEADVVFVCVGTPPGADGRPNLTALRSATKSVGQALRNHTVVITKSTVPIGWAQQAERLLADAATDEHATVGVVSNPEFLREGTAVKDFLYPDRIVIGGTQEALAVVSKLYEPIVTQSFDDGDPTLTPTLVTTDVATAETVKYAANAFLASKISFINEISRIADTAGADIEQIADALGLDRRIERRFLGAGIGYGGSCFPKDLEALTFYGVDQGLDLPMLNAVNPSNIRQQQQVVIKLRNGLGGLDNVKVALLGLAYKPDTDDIRSAPAITIAHQLLERKAIVTAYDPVVKAVPDVPELQIAPDVYSAITGCDAIVLVTEWKSFGDLDFAKIADLMNGDLVVDGRNWLDAAAVRAAGLRYTAMGRQGATPMADGT